LGKSELTEEVEPALRGLLKRVPFLKITSVKKEVSLGTTESGLVDWIFKVASKGGVWTLLVEAKRNGQPREVRNAVLQLGRYQEQLRAGGKHYGVVVAPFISEVSARICSEAGVGYADFAGNARLSFDQVFIESRVAENPFLERRETRSIFAPRATRVLRHLLQGPLRSWKVTELAAAAEVSLGWVSAVRQQLLAQEWAGEVEGGLRLTNPAAVLDAWAKADDWKKRTEIREYSVLTADPVDRGAALRDLLVNEAPIFTQWLAGWLRRPYTVPVVVTAYVKQFLSDELLREKLLARRVPNGGNLWLVVPKDEGVRSLSQRVRGFELVSDVQIYLDLIDSGLRGDEQAEELRRAPDFAGGWP
jgi:hypothetical protein